MTEASNASIRNWYALNVVTESVAREAVEYALMEADALGTETNDLEAGLLRVTAYFAHRPERERVRAELFEALRIYNLPTSSVRDMTISEVPDEDWMTQWKRNWQPVEVGERFMVAPPWSKISSPGDRLVIRIEPGMAFGTGTHETTRLCLEAIERHFHGNSFLDVGTGTGILAIAAAKLCPRARIEACDTDVEAIAIARENARLNNVSDSITFYAGTLKETDASVDCVCANLTTETIIELLPLLISVSCGRLICSGILASKADFVIDALRGFGISNPLEVMIAGEWACFVV